MKTKGNMLKKQICKTGCLLLLMISMIFVCMQSVSAKVVVPEGASGWTKIEGKVYYVDKASGKILKNRIAGTKADGWFYVDKEGVRVKDRVIRRAVEFVQKNTKDSWSKEKKLMACFKALLKVPYEVHRDGPSAAKMRGYANHVFKTNRANCYRYSAALAYCAKVIGYDVRVGAGREAVRATSGLSPHGWTEIKYGDNWYVYDVSMQRHRPRTKLTKVLFEKLPYARIICNARYTMDVTDGKVTWTEGK